MLMGSRFAQAPKSFFYKDSHRVGKRLSLELFRILVIPLICLPGRGPLTSDWRRAISAGEIALGCQLLWNNFFWKEDGTFCIGAPHPGTVPTLQALSESDKIHKLKRCVS